mmetsp:Transcript_12297/g.23327  ORF Transcript_12297/g.23327 Transcript_12297/m.23327 type:complete len:245 (-) Transcript_12297:723-1457(-)
MGAHTLVEESPASAQGSGSPGGEQGGDGGLSDAGGGQDGEGFGHGGGAQRGAGAVRGGGGRAPPGARLHAHKRQLPRPRPQQDMHGVQDPAWSGALHPSLQLPRQPGRLQAGPSTHRGQRRGAQASHPGMRLGCLHGAGVSQSRLPTWSGEHGDREGVRDRGLPCGAPSGARHQLHGRRHGHRGEQESGHGAVTNGAGRKGCMYCVRRRRPGASSCQHHEGRLFLFRSTLYRHQSGHGHGERRG